MKTAKTLGPSSAELLLRLSGEGKTIFSIADACAITGQPYAATAALLSQMVRKGWLVRLVPGRYLIVPLEAGLESVPMTDRYVIARQVLAPLPYYISYASAMEIHQMTTQPINTVYVTVPRQRASRLIAGVWYRFIYASQRSFWGWEDVWVTDQEQVRVSDLEKTVLDCAARPDLCGGITELAKGIWLRKSDLNEERLVSYAQRLGHRAAARRLGFLLETLHTVDTEITREGSPDTAALGRPETISALLAFTSGSYALLDPTLPDQGPYRARWGLRINLDPEELKTIIWT